MKKAMLHLHNNLESGLLSAIQGQTMPRSIAAAVRRTHRLMQPQAATKSMRRMQTSMIGAMVRAFDAPLVALTPKPTRSRKGAGRAMGLVRSGVRAVTPRVSSGAQYLARKHRCAAGVRDYKLYIPKQARARPRGVILMLHGCHQTPDDFAAGTHMNGLADKHGLIIAYPAQGSRDNLSACWNWFKPAHQHRGAGEPAILASLARKLRREFGLGRDAVFVAGLSAGGAMAAILADVYPDVFAAAGIHSGLARGAAGNVLSAMTAMRKGGGAVGTPVVGPHQRPLVRRILFQGDADGTVHASNAAKIVAAALGPDPMSARTVTRRVRDRAYLRSDYAGADGTVLVELWMIEGGGHAWSGGRKTGSYTDSTGPDASAQMVRFFLTDPG